LLFAVVSSHWSMAIGFSFYFPAKTLAHALLLCFQVSSRLCSCGTTRRHRTIVVRAKKNK
jgi:hypothetical protein